MRIDYVTLEVMRNALQSIAEEMGAALIRTARSPNIKDRKDCSTAIYDGKGKLIAQAEHIPLHLGLMPAVVNKVIDWIGVENFHEGDSIIINDPYISGSHLPDICIVSPLYIKGKLVSFVANLAHHVDIGGITPGGMPVNSEEIFQEGLRIPPVKIVSRGEFQNDILHLIVSNTRTPEECQGDIQAQLAAINVGKKRLEELYDKYGTSMINEAMQELINYSEQRTRAKIEELEDSVFNFTDYLEGDGFSQDLIEITVNLSIKGEQIKVDFTGTAPQVRGSVNCTRSVTLACVYYAVKSYLDPELPSNHGITIPIEVITPAGTIVNPNFPAAVSNANINTAQRITDVVLGALSHSRPDQGMAASCGSMNLFTIGGINPETGKYFSYVETYGGGQGAFWDQDGMDGVHTNMTNTRNTPVEVMEIEYPLRVNYYGLIPDSEGPGRFRGGLGLTRSISILSPSAFITLSTERKQVQPWGLFEGKEARGSKCYLINPEGEQQELGTKVTRSVNEKTTVVIETSGGGGLGNPEKRSKERIREDVREGFIGEDRARAMYGK